VEKIIERLRNRDIRFLDKPEDDDPYAMIFVVNDDKNKTLYNDDVLNAVTTATLRMVTSERHQEAVDAWLEQRIRKLVKRARNNQWDALESIPHIEVEFNSAIVRVFPPMRVSEVPQEIRRLQLTGLNTEPNATSLPEPGSLLITLNSALTMTIGKAAAQTGHAAQLFLMKGDERKVEEWIEAGYPLSFATGPVNPAAEIQVHDAGFTEVEPNSLTTTADLL